VTDDETAFGYDLRPGSVNANTKALRVTQELAPAIHTKLRERYAVERLRSESLE
jgi:hypothetical protein